MPLAFFLSYRFMRGDEAKEACPQIQLVQVPVARGKADLNTYRDAGSEVKWNLKAYIMHYFIFYINLEIVKIYWKIAYNKQVVAILARKGRCQRASVDEVYLDLTEAAEKMLTESPPEELETIEDEVLKSHILGLTHQVKFNAVSTSVWWTSVENMIDGWVTLHYGNLSLGVFSFLMFSFCFSFLKFLGGNWMQYYSSRDRFLPLEHAPFFFNFVIISGFSTYGIILPIEHSINGI